MMPKIFVFTVLVVGLLSAIGCSNDYGTQIQMGKSELYYTSNVSASDANRLADYLESEGFFDGDGVSLQLDKSDTTWEFKMVVKEGWENDLKFIITLKFVANELSANVFGGSYVVIHLCDRDFDTLQVIP